MGRKVSGSDISANNNNTIALAAFAAAAPTVRDTACLCSLYVSGNCIVSTNNCRSVYSIGLLPSIV